MANTDQFKQDDQKNLDHLSLLEIKELWSKTYNPNGKPDWSHIFPFYHEEITFHDSIQKLSGIDKFQKMCNRLTKRCRSLHMEIKNISRNEDIIFLEWKMTMAFRIFPSSPIYGSSRLTIKDGKIIQQRDYYDLWGDIIDYLPIIRNIYRFFMRTFFG